MKGKKVGERMVGGKMEECVEGMKSGLKERWKEG